MAIVLDREVRIYSIVRGIQECGLTSLQEFAENLLHGHCRRWSCSTRWPRRRDSTTPTSTETKLGANSSWSPATTAKSASTLCPGITLPTMTWSALPS